MFSCEYFEIFKNTFFERVHAVAAQVLPGNKVNQYLCAVICRVFFGSYNRPIISNTSIIHYAILCSFFDRNVFCLKVN